MLYEDVVTAIMVFNVVVFTVLLIILFVYLIPYYFRYEPEPIYIRPEGTFADEVLVDRLLREYYEHVEH